jgi:hypothetical protein
MYRPTLVYKLVYYQLYLDKLSMLVHVYICQARLNFITNEIENVLTQTDLFHHTVLRNTVFRISIVAWQNVAVTNFFFCVSVCFISVM